MPETKPIPVRLSPEVIARLDATATALGNTRAGIIKLCLTAFLEAFESKGKLALPLDWESILDVMDGRTKEAREMDSQESSKSTSTPELASGSPGRHAVAPGKRKGSKRHPDGLSEAVLRAHAQAAYLAAGLARGEGSQLEKGDEPPIAYVAAPKRGVRAPNIPSKALEGKGAEEAGQS